MSRAATSPYELFAVEATGRHLLINGASAFGRLDDGRFTPLSGLADAAPLAW